MSSSLVRCRSAERADGRDAGEERPTRAGRRLRVCLVRQFWFELDSRVQRLAYALADRGADVDVVCLSASAELRAENGVIRLHQAGSSRMNTTSGAHAYLVGYLRFLALAARRVAVLDRERRFDLVQVHTMPDALALAALAPKLRGVPVLLDVHDTFPELFATRFRRGPGDLFVRLVEREERLGAAVATAMLTVTEEARERLASRGVGLGKTSVVMNSPDERAFGPPRDPVLVPHAGPARCVYHGGMASRFGADLVVRAFGILSERCPRAELDVYGMGDEREDVARLAAEVAPEAVHVSSTALPFEKVPARLAHAHIGIVPTLHDGFTELLLPVKLLEYIHMGLPVVVSRLPTIELYFGEDEVTFFEPGSESSLAEAVVQVCADPESARRRTARASARLGELAWSVQRRRYLSLVDSLVGASNGRRA